jgi:hypothetical protein
MDWRTTTASSFADINDVAAFRRCKARGNSDRQCFRVGDNGVGCWGHPTSATKLAICALPPDDMIARWGSINAARDMPVAVRCNGVTIVCRLRDRMPWRRNIRNGCGIDLNPSACASLGLRPPVKVKVEWSWARG